MATATATLSIYPYPQGIDNSQRVIYVTGTVAIQASPATYATGGLTLNWTGLLQTVTNLPIVAQGTDLAPFLVWFQGVGLAGSTVGGYTYVWNKASDTFQIGAAVTVTAGTGPTFEEMTNGTAIPAAVSNDTIQFEATFVRAFS